MEKDFMGKLVQKTLCIHPARPVVNICLARAPGTQEQPAIQPSLNPSFLLCRKIICYNRGSVVK